MGSTSRPQAETAHGQPVQRFGTAGIAPMQRPRLTTRAFMRVVALVERLNLACSKAGNPPIYDNAMFPWVQEIERDRRAIRAELDQVLTRQEELPGFHELAADVATTGCCSISRCSRPSSVRGSTTRMPGRRSSTPKRRRCGTGSLLSQPIAISSMPHARS